MGSERNGSPEARGQLNQAATTADLFNQYRGLLFAIAYRMMGSGTDAEDIVQEAFVRWLQASSEEVQSPKAYLSAVVMRLCIDQVRSARAQRELYVGPWLPEPIPTGQHQELVDNVVLTESLSFAFLIMLQRLKPLERAVFLLREVFDYDYTEIAEIVGKSEANCRQVLHRAHQQVGEQPPRFAVSHEQQERITYQFIQASTSGDMQGLLKLLTDDIVFTADGGGKVQAARNSLYGADKATRGMLGGMSKLPSGIQGRIEEINGQPAIIGYVDGHVYGVVLLEIVAEQVRRIYMILNPDKLGRLNSLPM
ncbi:MAG: RNA polymerase sigma-70 factor [Herpetosiphonaceae bacterium]|nr:RNA polymerase sigma-70 factor [Herpetosiphonaceae bacterium]